MTVKSKRAVLVVPAEVDHGPMEVRVDEFGARDEQLAGERFGHDPIMSNMGASASAPPSRAAGMTDSSPEA